jgi:PAS domain S-box-containing protein
VITDADATALLALIGHFEGAVLRVDPRSLRVEPVGERAQTLVAMSRESFWHNSLPAADRADLEQTVALVWADGVPRSFEHRLLIPGRPERWQRTAFHRVEAGLLALMVDVTAAHHNEQQWREVETWLMTLGETLPFDFWICDGDGRCVLQNPASILRLGNVQGLKPADALEPRASREHWREAFPRVLNGEQVREEVRYEVQGQLRTFARVVAPVRDGDQVHGVLGLDIDITELKETEARLRRSLTELSAAQATLVRQQQLSALGEMAAVVAHEVRNPLGSISNAIALLRRNAPLDEAHAALCRIMEDEVRRLDLLVVSLLDFTRPMSAELQPRAITGVVDEALTQTLRADAGAGRIRVVKEIDDTLAPVLMDVRLITVALTNLFRNAVQAMGGEGLLHVTVDRESGTPADWARVRIRDSGPGIPPQVLERMFQPFVTTRPMGSGLGLSIVRRAVDAHHGQLDFHSEPGRGTTCTVRLPVVRDL